MSLLKYLFRPAVPPRRKSAKGPPVDPGVQLRDVPNPGTELLPVALHAPEELLPSAALEEVLEPAANRRDEAGEMQAPAPTGRPDLGGHPPPPEQPQQRSAPCGPEVGFCLELLAGLGHPAVQPDMQAAASQADQLRLMCHEGVILW